MTTVGQIEKRTQARIVALFQERLGYDYLVNKIDGDNRNIATKLLTAWLEKQGISGTLIARALHELLRYGVKVLPAMGENKVTVWLIDWKHPEKNHFAVAEEVTVKGADAKASTKRPDVVIYINGIAIGVLELTLNGVGRRGHTPEPGQPEKGVHPALLLDHAVDHGGQRHRRSALRHHRDARKILPALGGGERPPCGRAQPARPSRFTGVRQGAPVGADARLCGV